MRSVSVGVPETTKLGYSWGIKLSGSSGRGQQLAGKLCQFYGEQTAWGQGAASTAWELAARGGLQDQNRLRASMGILNWGRLG